MPEAPQIKGFALRGLLKHVKESGYAGGIPGLLEKLPDEARPLFEEKILSSSWYPYQAFSALAQTMAREMGGDDGSLMLEVGRASGRRDLGGIFRFITAILTVERVVRRAPAFWKRYCDTGNLEVVEAGSNHFVVRLTGFPEIDPLHCRLITGWIFGLGDGTSTEGVEVQEQSCVHRGGDCCEFRGTWR